ncbi:hypothetical protein BV22DRAFT_1126245 [Leucogyrophana mollusca]|uniref:Uncharacterized protein n=1 Tax=Leucogyrophana mollusca TaxID=85980 RepID=A0ACB8BV18_9AGAM|nr:hypothetical protein BV22DRAFT_1126245 [Leucogyrophana mollusca]
MTAQVDGFIKDNLTAQRGIAKIKIFASIEAKTNVGALGRTLGSPGHDLTFAHLGRKSDQRLSASSFLTVVDSCAKRVAAQKEREVSGAAPEVEEEPVLADDATPEQIAAAAKAKKDKERIWIMSEYWEFLDSMLIDLRAEARAATETPAAREEHVKRLTLVDAVTRLFTECLQADLKQYPAGDSSLSTTPDNMVVAWQRAIHNDLIW